MGASRFDRDIFVAPRPVEPEVGLSFYVRRALVPLAVVLMIGVAGFLAYKMLRSASAPNVASNRC